MIDFQLQVWPCPVTFHRTRCRWDDFQFHVRAEDIRQGPPRESWNAACQPLAKGTIQLRNWRMLPARTSRRSSRGAFARTRTHTKNARTQFRIESIQAFRTTTIRTSARGYRAFRPTATSRAIRTTTARKAFHTTTCRTAWRTKTARRACRTRTVRTAFHIWTGRTKLHSQTGRETSRTTAGRNGSRSRTNRTSLRGGTHRKAFRPGTDRTAFPSRIA